MAGKHETKEMMVSVDKLELDPEVYPRHNNNDWMMSLRYGEAMQNGDEFPPIHVVANGNGDGKYAVLDGWNRTLAARRIKRTELKAIVYEHLPHAEWFPLAVELNRHHGKQYTVQDRVMIANRLKGMGYDLDKIADLTAASKKTVQKWIAGRIVKDDKGQDVALKGAMAPAAGTTRERDAIKYAGPIANANVNRTLDELTALLRAGMVDVAHPTVREKVLTIQGLLKGLFGKKKKTS